MFVCIWDSVGHLSYLSICGMPAVDGLHGCTGLRREHMRTHEPTSMRMEARTHVQRHTLSISHHSPVGHVPPLVVTHTPQVLMSDVTWSSAAQTGVAIDHQRALYDSHNYKAWSVSVCVRADKN